jgi:hypothetical protein
VSQFIQRISANYSKFVRSSQVAHVPNYKRSRFWASSRYAKNFASPLLHAPNQLLLNVLTKLSGMTLTITISIVSHSHIIVRILIICCSRRNKWVEYLTLLLQYYNQAKAVCEHDFIPPPLELSPHVMSC